MTKNPLLDFSALPHFDDIRLEHFQEAIAHLIKENRDAVSKAAELEEVSWQALVAPLQEASQRLSSAWGIVSHYNAVLNSDELRPVYEQLLAQLTRLRTEISLNPDLYQAYKRLRESDEFSGLSEEQKASLEFVLRDFHLSGVDLPMDKKKRYAEISESLSRLFNKFSQNVLDATEAWTLYIEDEGMLEGVPESAKSMYRAAARSKGHESGCLVTLEIPSYLPMMTYCENRELRRELYEAYMTRASDQGPHAGNWDNTPVMLEILALRKELAGLLGFDNYAKYSLSTKMATDTSEVLLFLEDLAGHCRAPARREFEELETFAKKTDDLSGLEMWDIAYYSEKLKQSQYGISKEELRPYFPADKVKQGLFELISLLFGVTLVKRPDAPTFHADAQCFEVHVGGELAAHIYVDLYARSGKRGGAWMAGFRSRYLSVDGSIRLPCAFVVCNFTPPGEKGPSLLTPDEVTTLFHEFGHALHHTLTQKDVANVSGISNVPWDAVELPSQLMENWCFHSDVLPLISGHVESGAPLPTDMLEQLIKMQKFQSGMQMVRQLEFALFDFNLHRQYQEGSTDIEAVLDEARNMVSVKKPPAFTRFANGFGHIFAGGYAAGYYSYKWAEVLSADAFSRFEEEGVMSPQVGQAFRDTVLANGGARDISDLYRAFRGREPSIDALLRHAGIESQQEEQV